MRQSALKACRDCLQQPGRVRGLMARLQSHLRRGPDRGRFHRHSRPDPLGEVCQAVPAGAQQPCREPAQEAVPTMALSASPAPLTPLASILAADPQDQCNIKSILQGPATTSSPPGNSFGASAIPAIWSLGLASRPMAFLSCWWETTKALFFPTSPKWEAQQEPTSPEEASNWESPTHSWAETSGPSLVSPPSQRLLDILIPKRLDLKFHKEREKEGSFSTQSSSAYPLSSLGMMWTPLSRQQEATTLPSFGNIKDKAELLPGPQQFLYPEVLRDYVECTYSQLFWGLPSLHSKALVTTAFVPWSSSQLQAPPILLYGISSGFPEPIPLRISGGFSQDSFLPCPEAQPQPSTQILPQSQALFLPQTQAQPFLPLSLLFRPPSAPPQLGTLGLYCPTFQKKALYFTPAEMQPLACPWLQKQQLQKRTTQNQRDRGLPLGIPLSLAINPSQCPLVDMQPAQGQEEPRQPSPLTASSGLGPYKTRARSPTRSPRRCQMTNERGKDFLEALEPCLRRVSKYLLRASLPDTFLERTSDMGAERSLQRDSAKCFPRVPDRRHLETTLKVHLRKKVEEIHKGLIPVTVQQSWLAVNQSLPKCHSVKKSQTPASWKYWKPYVNTSREMSVLNPGIQQMLEVHIMSFRVRHMWDFPTQAFEPIHLKPSRAQPSPLPRSTFSPSATQKPREHSKAKVSSPGLVADLKGIEESSQGQQKSIKPKRRDPYNSQGVRLAPTDEWRGFKRLQPEEHKNSKSSQRPQQPPNPKVRNPCKGQMASDDEEVCKWLLPEDDDETNSQREMFAPDKEWQGFKRPKPKAHKERKSWRERFAPTDEWRGFKRLQPEEHKNSKSSQRPQQPPNPKVRDPCKGQMASDDEEVCEWLLPEDDDETNSQREMFAPDKEWQGFKRPKPKAHKQRASWRERFAPTDERRGFTKLQSEAYEEKFSGLRASQANAVSHPPKVKERGESLGSKDLPFSPREEHILPESSFRRRMKHFLQHVSPHQKGKGTETVLQKGKPVSLTAPSQEPVKCRSGHPEAEVTGTVIGQILGKQPGLRQDLQPSELNQHTQQLQPPAAGQSHYQKIRMFFEQKRLLRNRAHGHQTTPKDPSSLNSGGTKDKAGKGTSPPKDLGTPGRPCQQGPMVAGTSGHLHHPLTCSPPKGASAGQPGCAPQALPGRRIPSMLRKHVSPSC
ncbi:spermatogenesis-associated protein 31E1-like [Phacochoerus africanus]|uniref:spermatogenesis-associated protein 31E1-like n=1 Tax=Phacochoerus africanus TaxID=41426 RepID=UPI001FD925C3|nr:spermatogenesis-associated protein 31E1-like [Phacochoerus africanus]